MNQDIESNPKHIYFLQPQKLKQTEIEFRQAKEKAKAKAWIIYVYLKETFTLPEDYSP